MNLFFFSFVLSFVLLFPIQNFSQKTDTLQKPDTTRNPENAGDKFFDANLLMEDKRYKLALPIWLDLLRADTGNANLNYKVGLSYYNSATERFKSLSYLKKCIGSVTKNYDPFSNAVKQAPITALYYYARALQVNYFIDTAMFYFNQFLTEAGKKHYLIEDVMRQLEMCENAKVLMKSPVTIKITNLGKPLNSEAPEYGPVISLDENTIYYTSRRLWPDSSNISYVDFNDGQYFEDIYASYRDRKTGLWQKPEALNINRLADHEATLGLGAGGQTLYIYRDDNGNGNIYKSQFNGTEWSLPELMGSDVNTKANESHISESVDGRSIYFVSERSDGQGKKDIYSCSKLPNGQWSKAQNIGSLINTKYDEDGVYIHPDGKTLYFSSKGHNSMGGFDIFVSYLKENGSWSAPENLGHPINTTDDDIFYVSTPDGKRAYFSSVRPEGNGDKDIYVMEQPEALSKALTLLKGYIDVPPGQPLPDVNIIITDIETGELIASGKALKRNGSFVFIIPPGKNYNIAYDIDGKEFYNENLFVPVGTEYKEVQKEISVNTLKIGTSQKAVTSKQFEMPDPGPRWEFEFADLKRQSVDGLTIQYITEGGDVIYEEKLRRDGRFKFIELTSKQYIMKFKEDTVSFSFCDKTAIIYYTKDGITYRLEPDEHCIYRRWDDKVAKFAYSGLSKIVPGGLVMQYLDDKGNIIYEETTNEKGEFNFHALPSEKGYMIKLFSSDPSLCGKSEIVVPGPGNTKMTFISDDKCVFRLKSTEEKLQLSFLGKDVPDGLSIQYYDDKGKLMFEETVGKNGEFNFKDLPAEKSFMIKLKTDDPSLCDKTNLRLLGNNPTDIVFSSSSGNTCSFIAKRLPFKIRETDDKAQFTFLGKDTPDGLKIQYLDDAGMVLLEETLGKKGEFNYIEMPSAKSYVLKLSTSDPSLCKKARLKFLSSKTKDIEFEVSPTDPCTFLAKRVTTTKATVKPAELQKDVQTTYATNFKYNQKTTDTEDKKFQKLINEITDLVNKNNMVDVTIESSASRVPTKTFASNETLARMRAEEFQKLLVSVLNKKGIDKSKIIIAKTSSLVQGPAYKGDYDSNRTEYEKFQYVKIFVY